MVEFSECYADNAIMIYRRLQAEILESLKQFPAVGLIGPRQAGKTTLAKMLADSIEQPVKYLDLENPQDMQKLDNAQLYLQQFQDHLIILDEAQRKPSLL